jgi:hypothetical protein
MGRCPRMPAAQMAARAAGSKGCGLVVMRRAWLVMAWVSSWTARRASSLITPVQFARAAPCSPVRHHLATRHDRLTVQQAPGGSACVTVRLRRLSRAADLAHLGPGSVLPGHQ